METEGGITKEFLQEVLKSPVTKFVVNKGSNIGDGYTCVLYSVDVWLQNESEPLPILVKCFPTNPARQELLQTGDVFGTELHMYDQVIPGLQKFLKEQNADDIRLPFAPFLGGQEMPVEKRNGPTKQLDNYLVMTDLRKKGGFQLRDRFKGLDVDHFKLVMEGQATLHAVSWAFKQIKMTDFTSLYPFLSGEGFSEMINKFSDSFLTTIQGEITEFQNEPRLCEVFKYLHKIFMPAFSLYFNTPLRDHEKHFNKDNIVKIPGKTLENEEPWAVLRHGDCWINNLLFRYDQITRKPVEVTFIDLQICEEGDPFGDIMYSLCCNTTQETRKKHLPSFLHIYFDTFTQVCQRFNVEPLPGWSWEEFNRRFRRAMTFGLSIAAAFIPTTLIAPTELKDLEALDTTKDGPGDEDSVTKLVNEMMVVKLNEQAKERLRGIIEDGIEAGVV